MKDDFAKTKNTTKICYAKKPKTPQKYVYAKKPKIKRKNANGVFKEEETSFFSFVFFTSHFLFLWLISFLYN